MPGIANLTIDEFQNRINHFRQRYVHDWNEWLDTPPNNRANELGVVLRRWQACRPNTMRRTQAENRHDPPFLEDIIAQALPHLNILQDFEIRYDSSFSKQNCESLSELWNIFTNLSYGNRSRNGLAGVVGISKAALLLTDGGVGPAFDSRVQLNLQLGDLEHSDQWIDALLYVSHDIQQFEMNNETTLQKAAPPMFAALRCGRLYDMALGPGE
jgi:hypothetical protein